MPCRTSLMHPKAECVCICEFVTYITIAMSSLKQQCQEACTRCSIAEITRLGGVDNKFLASFLFGQCVGVCSYIAHVCSLHSTNIVCVLKATKNKHKTHYLVHHKHSLVLWRRILLFSQS